MIGWTAALGYWGVLFGTFLEGETVLVMAGYAAHRGWLELPWVIAVAFVGAGAGDQFYFYLGRRRGRGFLDRRPRLRRLAEPATRLLQRRQDLVAVSSRFLYGLRIVVPVLLGAGDLGAGRFAVLNAIGAAIWSVAFALGGWFVGDALAAALRDFGRYERHALVGIGAVGVLVWAGHWWRSRRRLRQSGADGAARVAPTSATASAAAHASTRSAKPPLNTGQ